MPRPEEEKAEALVFAGMASTPDPRDLAPGLAKLQLNLTCVRPGALFVRRGLREITYDSEE